MEEAHARPLSGQRLDPDPINPQTRGVCRRHHWICFVTRVLPVHLRLASHVVCDGALQLCAPERGIRIAPGWQDVAGVEALHCQSANSGVGINHRFGQL